MILSHPVWPSPLSSLVGCCVLPPSSALFPGVPSLPHPPQLVHLPILWLAFCGPPRTLGTVLIH